jgi:hypothetical protein
MSASGSPLRPASSLPGRRKTSDAYGLQGLNPRKNPPAGSRHLLLFSVNAVPSIAKRLILPASAIVSIFAMAGGASGSGISSSAGGSQRHVGGGGGAAGVYLRHTFGRVLFSTFSSEMVAQHPPVQARQVVILQSCCRTAALSFLRAARALPCKAPPRRSRCALGGSPSGPWDLASKGGDGGGLVSGAPQPASAGENRRVAPLARTGLRVRLVAALAVSAHCSTKFSRR